ncbi:unnamed protein product [Closterium sp. NIES-65]|nr:unnamed protein product [Closterium sp. NIES-65]
MCMDEASKGSPHAHFFLQDAACASLRTFFGLQPLVPPLMLVPVSARNVADASDRQGGGGGAGGGAGAGGGRNGDESSSPLHGFSSSPLSPYGHSSARKKNRSIGTLKLQVRKVRMTSKGDEGRGGDGGQGEGENQGSAGGAAGGTGGTGGAGGAVSSMMRQIKGGMANLRGLAAEATTAAPEGVLVAVRCPSEEAGEARRVNPNTHHCINLPVQWRAIDKKWWWRMTAMGAAGGQATCAFSPPFFSPPFFSPPFFSPPFFSPPFFSPPLFSPPFFFLSPLFLSHLQTHGEQSTTSGGGGAWPQWVKWAANSGVEVHLPHLYLTPSLPSLSSLPTLPSLPSLPFRPVESDRQEEIAINPPQPVESDRQEVVVEVHDRSGLRGQATVAAAVPLLPSHPSLPSLPSLAPLPIRPVESERQEVVVEVHDRSGSRGQASVAASTLMDEGHPGAHVSLSQRCHWLAVRDTCQQEVARVQLAVSLVPCARDYGTQCQPITESAAYDWVLAAAMAAQGFHARNLRLSGPWEWLCDQFATCYGVSPHYTKLRYLTRVMDVATPTADCLTLIHQLLAPVLHAHDSDGSSVTKQEARMLADMEERVGGLLQLTFESYKSLSEASPSASPIAHFPPPPPTSLQPSVLIPPQARMLADMEERVGGLLQRTFESYKSLSEASPSGIANSSAPLPTSLHPSARMLADMEERVGDLLQLTFESYKSLSAHASRHGGESRRPPATHLRELQVAQRGFPFRHRQLLCTATHISAPLCSPPPQARMLADMEERVGDLLQLTFESYKSLSEASPSGIADSSRSATHLCASLGRSLVGAEAAALVAPAIPPAVHLFGLLNDLLLPEVQQQFCGYLQVSLGYYWEQGCKGWGREGHWGDRWWGQRRPHERRSVLRRLKTLLLSRGITGSRGVRAGEGKGTGEIAGGGRGGRTGDAGDSPCGVPVWAAERLAAARGAAAVLRLPAGETGVGVLADKGRTLERRSGSSSAARSAAAVLPEVQQQCCQKCSSSAARSAAAVLPEVQQQCCQKCSSSAARSAAAVLPEVQQQCCQKCSSSAARSAAAVLPEVQQQCCQKCSSSAARSAAAVLPEVQQQCCQKCSSSAARSAAAVLPEVQQQCCQKCSSSAARSAAAVLPEVQQQCCQKCSSSAARSAAAVLPEVQQQCCQKCSSSAARSAAAVLRLPAGERGEGGVLADHVGKVTNGAGYSPCCAPTAARRRCRQHLSETDEYVNGTFCVLVLRSHLPHSPLPSHTDSSEAAVPATLTAARRRCRQHLSETDEYVNGTFCLGTGGSTMQAQAQGQAGMGCSPGGGRGRGGGGPGGMGAGGMGRGAMRGGEGGDMEEQREAYGSMRLACVAMWREVQADIGIHNQHILPSFVDLPELTAGVYMVELQRRVNQFLLAVPPQHPLPHVKNLLHATADVEDRLMLWGVGKVPGGLDARELFGVYVEAWIRERTHTLMDVCRAPKWAVLAPMSDRNATSPFMEEVYSVINSLLDELDSVLGRWPQYTLLVEEAVCDVERAAISSLASHFQNFLLLLNTPSSSSAPSSTKKKLLGMLSRRRPTLAYQVPIEVSPSLAVPIEVSPSLAVPIEVSPSLAVPIEVSPSLALPIEANGFPTPIVLPAFPALPLPALPLPALPLPALPLPALPLPALPLPPSLPLRASPFPPLSPFQLAVYLNMMRGGETIRECEYGGGGREVLFGEVLFGEMLSEVTVELRTTYRATLQDVVEKLYENTQLGLTTSQKRVPHHIAEASAQEGPFLMEPHNTQLGRTTSLTRVLKEVHSFEMRPLFPSPSSLSLLHLSPADPAGSNHVVEASAQGGDDMISKLQPLSALIAQADAVLSSRVFVRTARGLWDRHGREVLKFPTLSILPSPTPFFPSHQADAVLSSRVFVGTARGLWDRHGREVLHFLEKRREGVSWFKSASAAITLDTLDNLFTQQMQRLQGHALMERDLEHSPPLAFPNTHASASKHTFPSCHPSHFPSPHPPSHQTLDNLFTQQMQRLQGHSLMERDLEPPRAICDARGVLSKGGAPAATARVHDSLSLY